MHDMLATSTFFGNDVDARMVSLATMNLMLRGLPDVHILRRNVLTTTLDRTERAELGLPLDGFDVVLANPPFSGKIDKDRIVDEVKVGTTTATEILFVKYMLNSLKPGGRCGVIVPEGVLFGSTGAHKELRRQLIENNTVDAVLSLPGGVFAPYSGVKTSVLLFRKGGATERVMFLHADADGYKLDANHDQPIDDDDLPGLVEAFKDREACWRRWQARDPESRLDREVVVRDAPMSFAPTTSISPPAATVPRPASRSSTAIPLEILDELKAIEVEILEEIDSSDGQASVAGCE